MSETETETTALLLEIGCEEIPARFLEQAERGLGERLIASLREARLVEEGQAVKTASTPRRLVAYVPALLRQQFGRTEKLTGPPVKAAFDSEGKPTRAAESFAAKNGATIADLKRIATAKGEYIAIERVESGRRSDQVLVEVLPEVIGSLTFPKNMYWTAKAGPLFVRPIRWIVALLGETDSTSDHNEGKAPRVVPFEFAGVKAGSATYGNRWLGNQVVSVRDLNLDITLREHLVILDPVQRREQLRSDVKVLLDGTPWKAVPDESLEDWIVNSTEWPVPLIGTFDSRYLALPREVLVTVMRDHQKYLAVEDWAGNLQPHFITVLNMPGDPKGLIRQGHERVLAARFADAEFFWNSDQRVTLANRVSMLERVTYQARLGTYADKIRRMKVFAEKICAELEKSESLNSDERQHALRAIELAKCDLTTQMVQEFTELQGIMGGLYAAAQGEPAEVAEAIYDQYRPASMEDSPPRSVAGAVVSLADKFDSVLAGFAAGLEPSGSSDPFGLRRAGNGVIKVVVEVLPGLNLGLLLDHAAALDLALPKAASEVAQKVEAFYRERLEFYLGTLVRYDIVRAVVAAGWGIPSQVVERARALEAVRDSDDFAALSVAAKRTRNILLKSANFAGPQDPPQPELFTEDQERALYNGFLAAEDRLVRCEAEGDYAGAFLALAGLRPAVDAFFDKVLVMHPDERLRENRLRLLSQINRKVFLRLADLSEIVPEGGESGVAAAGL